MAANSDLSGRSERENRLRLFAASHKANKSLGYVCRAGSRPQGAWFDVGDPGEEATPLRRPCSRDTVDDWLAGLCVCGRIQVWPRPRPWSPAWPFPGWRVRFRPPFASLLR